MDACYHSPHHDASFAGADVGQRYFVRAERLSSEGDVDEAVAECFVLCRAWRSDHVGDIWPNRKLVATTALADNTIDALGQDS